MTPNLAENTMGFVSTATWSLYHGFLMVPARLRRRLDPRDEVIWKRLWPVTDAQAVVTTDFGLRMCVRCEKFGDLIAAFGREDERRIPELLASVPAGGTVLDVGAHIGRYSLMAARAVGKGGRVFAFEPDSANVRLLEMNAKFNSFDQIKSVRAAVGNKTGMIDLLVSDIDTCWASTRRDWVDILHSGQALAHTRAERVPMVSIDEFINEQRISNVALVKIDVEAAELDVLAGAKQSLSEGRIRKIIVEIHEPPNKVVDVTSLLTRYNYELEQIGPGEVFGVHRGVNT